MLPEVDADEGSVADEGVLVGSRNRLERLALGVVREPGPARALDSERNGVDLSLEAVERSERLGDGVSERAGGGELGLGRGGRSEVLPEERMVDVAAAVKLDGRLEGDLLLDVGRGRGEVLGRLRGKGMGGEQVEREQDG